MERLDTSGSTVRAIHVKGGGYELPFGPTADIRISTVPLVVQRHLSRHDGQHQPVECGAVVRRIPYRLPGEHRVSLHIRFVGRAD